jgi:UDP-N-acetylglucosamine 2-epimerase (non-hydrolysing)
MLNFVVGTRPEGIKIRPVVAECKSRGIPHRVIHTGQHTTLFEQVGLVPDISLGVAPDTSSDLVDRLTGALWGHLDDWIVVQGDTSSAFAGARVGALKRVPVYHIEAGIRSGDLENPKPEEGYRRYIDSVATAGACATVGNQRNLDQYKPGGPNSDINCLFDPFPVTGNPGIDALYQRQQPVPWSLRCQSNVVVTLHRRESWGVAMREILQGIVGTTRYAVLFSHPNGEARRASEGLDLEVQPPTTPQNFSIELALAGAVVTDSGGVQEEAAALGIPCVVARDVTDRPESVDSNQAIVAGRTSEGIRTALERALSGELSRKPSTVFGDGQAAARIVDHLEKCLGPA